ncbi:MAG: hypothetical protein J3Q66DRAFT_396940 [Benniella sp.]|nr:MAG: hypothetical protein J3Q66DRAFT_396940 [Benniella sp.]
MKSTSFLTAFASILIIGTFVRAESLESCGDPMYDAMDVLSIENTPLVTGKDFCISVMGAIAGTLSKGSKSTLNLKTGTITFFSTNKDICDCSCPLEIGVHTLKVCIPMPALTVNRWVYVELKGVDQTGKPLFCANFAPLLFYALLESVIMQNTIRIIDVSGTIHVAGQAISGAVKVLD